MSKSKSIDIELAAAAFAQCYVTTVRRYWSTTCRPKSYWLPPPKTKEGGHVGPPTESWPCHSSSR